eukprot:NODE_2342_length_1207_cov_19.638889_g2228_i0.p1 GENE.NODE_2342_length_1207_cov_19.638889_g2228_i0~~NODE_2342_length_1207_cov_19.638889_g2228_i0.p1  ORF type:complete len:353 (+),score=62.61 NODE_2342_length_1207_cov_19.638889_g2228_i0:71-1129(+)
MGGALSVEVIGAGLGVTPGQRFLSVLEYHVWAALNHLRANPTDYIPLIQDKLKYLDDHTKTFWLPSQPYGSISPEGRPVYEETIRFLTTAPSVPPFRDCPIALTLAARDHALDIGRNGLQGHDGTLHTTCGQRIARYCRWRVQCSEVIAYGVTEAVEILLQLVVDDGVPDRSHRLNLFGPAFTECGIAITPHSYWTVVCVIEMVVRVDPYSTHEALKLHNGRHGPPAAYRQHRTHAHRTYRPLQCLTHTHTTQTQAALTVGRRQLLHCRSANSPFWERELHCCGSESPALLAMQMIHCTVSLGCLNGKLSLHPPTVCAVHAPCATCTSEGLRWQSPVKPPHGMQVPPSVDLV